MSHLVEELLRDGEREPLLPDGVEVLLLDARLRLVELRARDRERDERVGRARERVVLVVAVAAARGLLAAEELELRQRGRLVHHRQVARAHDDHDELVARHVGERVGLLVLRERDLSVGRALRVVAPARDQLDL